MEVMAQGNRHIVDSDSKVDNNVVRQKVMDSYQDMLSGKGRDYKVFFAELESRYNGKKCIKCKFFPRRKRILARKSAPPPGALFCASIAALLPHEEISRICNIQKHARSPLTAGHASAGTGEYE